MALVTLALDASTYIGTVAVLRDHVLVAEGDALMRGEQEERLMPRVATVLAEAGYAVSDVERVICGGGPGSFTSLRIAGAIAKGIAMGNEVPLYGVSSLALIVAGHRPSLTDGRYLALLDAMRDERYAALYAVTNGVVTEIETVGRVAVADLALLCEQKVARAIGPREMIDAAPHARGVAIMLDGILAAGAVTLDTWEPKYGRLAEAQVKWEAAHGRPLPA
jgi:tRNA threonylcarbamoyladenosine biosynthesis protein TsaB